MSRVHREKVAVNLKILQRIVEMSIISRDMSNFATLHSGGPAGRVAKFSPTYRVGTRAKQNTADGILVLDFSLLGASSNVVYTTSNAQHSRHLML